MNEAKQATEKRSEYKENDGLVFGVWGLWFRVDGSGEGLWLVVCGLWFWRLRVLAFSFGW